MEQKLIIGCQNDCDLKRTEREKKKNGYDDPTKKTLVNDDGSTMYK